MIFKLYKLTIDEAGEIINVHKEGAIKIGSAFQAEIPEVTFKNDEFSNDDVKVWDPSVLPKEQVDEYLQSLNCKSAVEEEKALWVLHKCNYNADEALRQQRFVPPMILGFDSDWSEYERSCFEKGMHKYGKDFKAIQRLIRSKSVTDLVEFYYYLKHERMRSASMNENPQ